MFETNVYICVVKKKDIRVGVGVLPGHWAWIIMYKSRYRSSLHFSFYCTIPSRYGKEVVRAEADRSPLLLFKDILYVQSLTAVLLLLR